MEHVFGTSVEVVQADVAVLGARGVGPPIGVDANGVDRAEVALHSPDLILVNGFEETALEFSDPP